MTAVRICTAKMEAAKITKSPYSQRTIRLMRKATIEVTSNPFKKFKVQLGGHDLTPSLLAEADQDNIEDLPESIWQHMMELGSVHFPNAPIYRHSSCALSRMLQIPNLAGIQVTAKDDCEASRCPACQRETCTDSPLYGHNVQSLQQVLDGLGIPARAIGFDSVAGPITEPDLKSFTYAIRRTVLKKLAEGG